MNDNGWPALDLGRVRANTPHDMRAAHQWVMWKLEEREGKPTKVPYNALTGAKAESNNPSTWTSFDESLRAYEQGGYSGIGFMFGGGFFGVDLDKCRNPVTGQIEDWALTIIQSLSSFTEISPSQTGAHVFGKGKLPGAGMNRLVGGHKIEIYDSGRFFTFTADRVEYTEETVKDRQAQVELLYQCVEAKCEAERLAKAAKKNGQPKQSETQAPSACLSDSDLMERARSATNGAKF